MCVRCSGEVAVWRDWCDVETVDECLVLMWNEAQCWSPKKETVLVVAKHQTGMTRSIEIVDVVMMMNMIQFRPTPHDQQFVPCLMIIALLCVQ